MGMCNYPETGFWEVSPGSSSLAPCQVHGQDSQQQYIYCTLRDGVHSSVYYNDVFAGNYIQQIGYSVAFTNFVRGQLANVIGVANCFFGLGQGRARSADDGWRSNGRWSKEMLELV